MKLAILGGTGRTGRLVVEQAVAAGHEVTTLARHDDGTLAGPHVRVVLGDARSEADVARLLQGQEAAISTLGSTKLGDDLMARSTAALVVAAREAGVTRVVMLSSFLAAPPEQQSWLLALGRRLLQQVVRDYTAAQAAFEASGLDWTVVYATRLDGAPAETPARVLSADEKLRASNGIARAAVAAFLLAATSDPSLSQQAVAITGK